MPDAYKIAKGDTLTGIAKKNGLSTRELIALNPQIANPDRVSIGQAIHTGVRDPGVPAAPQSASLLDGVTGAARKMLASMFSREPEGAPRTGVPSIPEPSTVAIGAGQNLTQVARGAGMSLDALLAMNPEITDPNRVRAGQPVRVGREAPSVQPTKKAGLLSGAVDAAGQFIDRTWEKATPYAAAALYAAGNPFEIGDGFFTDNQRRALAETALHAGSPEGQRYQAQGGNPFYQNYRKHNAAWDVGLDPIPEGMEVDPMWDGVAKTIGGFSHERTEDGGLRITDRYDFNNTPRGYETLQAHRRAAGNEEGAQLAGREIMLINARKKISKLLGIPNTGGYGVELEFTPEELAAWGLK
jgi:murein DD-endopeptidase MepM/ murein hydrolase activator NlpD